MRTFALHLLTDASAEQISLLSQRLKESSDASGCNPDWVDLSVKGRERPYYRLTLSQRQCLLRQVGFLFHLQQVHLQQVLAQQAANRYPLGQRKTDKALDYHLKETELYPPLRDYFESHGYTVRSEVKHCDLTATRDDDLIVVELKTSANMTLLVQATDRQKITDSVYVAIPSPKKRNRHWRGIQRVLRSLQLGLITIDLDRRVPKVRVELDPMPYERKKQSRMRKSVIQEIAKRSGDYNEAGSTGTPLVTAYREEAIYIACCLQNSGATSTRKLRELGCAKRATQILYANHYGWFQRMDRGVYQLTAKGEEGLGKFSQLADSARRELQSLLDQEVGAGADKGSVEL